MPSLPWVMAMKLFWQTQTFLQRKNSNYFHFQFQFLFIKITFRSCCSDGAKYIDASGHGIPELLAAILEFFPLDTYVFNPVTLMDMVNADKKKDMKVKCMRGQKNFVKMIFNIWNCFR